MKLDIDYIRYNKFSILNDMSISLNKNIKEYTGKMAKASPLF